MMLLHQKYRTDWKVSAGERTGNGVLVTQVCRFVISQTSASTSPFHFFWYSFFFGVQKRTVRANDESPLPLLQPTKRCSKMRRLSHGKRDTVERTWVGVVFVCPPIKTGHEARIGSLNGLRYLLGDFTCPQTHSFKNALIRAQRTMSPMSPVYISFPPFVFNLWFFWILRSLAHLVSFSLTRSTIAWFTLLIPFATAYKEMDGLKERKEKTQSNKLIFFDRAGQEVGCPWARGLF